MAKIDIQSVNSLVFFIQTLSKMPYQKEKQQIHCKDM